MTPANHDLRAWLSEVEKIGQRRRISIIPWDRHMSGLVEMILEPHKRAPALRLNVPQHGHASAKESRMPCNADRIGGPQ